LRRVVGDQVRGAEPASAEHGALFVDAAGLETDLGRELVAAGFAGPDVPDLALAHMGGDGGRQHDVIAVRAARQSKSARQGGSGSSPVTSLHVSLLASQVSFFDFVFGLVERRLPSPTLVVRGVFVINMARR